MSTEFQAAGVLATAALFDNHDGFRPQASDALAGRELTVRDRHRVRFEDGATLTWDGRALAYEAFAVRDGIVAVVCRPEPHRSVFAVLDLDGGRALAVVSEIADARERTHYEQAGLDGPLAQPFDPTEELVGKRVLWRYSDTHAFEHIYLNPTCYCWHGVEGPERWVGAVDPCTTYKLADRLYLFAWSELAAAFNGAVVLDLTARVSVGRFFAWDATEPSQIVVGARGTLLNETRYA